MFLLRTNTNRLSDISKDTFWLAKKNVCRKILNEYEENEEKNWPVVKNSRYCEGLVRIEPNLWPFIIELV